MPGNPDPPWPPLGFHSAPSGLCAIGAAMMTPIVLIGTLSNLHPAGPDGCRIAALMRADPMLAPRR